ncbi:NB-ARC domain, LRR domain containing protein [Parasponia andersonii]|uniref:NB-ARC domain, LRR domain containing protein n=1 Tax=Parasponia andersonii TaxID=3476 RepID=A0A2P5ALC6_PARAD|nr:NB-ARC domain, LRR domain containing protein [Parasponia andersonii]
MAETAVGLVVDKLIPLLTEEAYLLRGIHKEVEEIRYDLDYIMSFLKDAETRAQMDHSTNSCHSVKVWVEKLRGAAFEVEDVIDEYTRLMSRQQSQHRHTFIGFLRKSACLVIKLKPRHDIASKIKDIKRKVKDINTRSASFGFNSALQQGSTSSSNQTNTWYDPRKDSRFLKETEVVGSESSRDELIRMLEGGPPRRSVISVVGMGGLGKTTLAHQVYGRKKGSFDCHAWITVSQSYKNEELLRELMKQFCQARHDPIPEGIDTLNEATMTIRLRDYLLGKSYFVIFDDVWDIHFWSNIQNSLPDDYERSGRIVITTRNVEIANSCRKSSYVHIHHLQPLPQEKAWELFCNKTFEYEFEGRCPTHLEMISQEIVKRCQGLPLAIVVIAGLLSTKNKTVDEWKKLLTSLSSELESNKHLESIKKILSLSYNDLPYYLKCCFMYFGIFPEDYSVRCGRLVRQWIAEGFVKLKKDKTLEAVAGEYLAELISRNLVQVSELHFDGRTKTCRVHDLLREIILNNMADSWFCQVLSENHPNFHGLTRRMSIMNGPSFDVIRSIGSGISHVRSLYFCDKDEIPNHLLNAITTDFKLLKVLDFEDASTLDHLPKDIGSLFHLKYLSVRRTKVRLLPKSIGELENLETLDVKQSLVQELPVEIKRLYKLRHLVASHKEVNREGSMNWLRGVKVESEIGQLKALQKLCYIEANVVEVDIIKELRELTELRKLGIIRLRSEDGRKLCDCIQRMNHLESLCVSSTSEDEMIDLESMSSPPLFLQRLALMGFLRKLPEWITRLQNLVRLHVYWSKLEDDPLKALKNLHNLLELALYFDAYYGEKLQFEEGDFPKLMVLRLRSLSKLRLLVIEEGALCSLEVLDIGFTPLLKELSCGFQHLGNLKQVSFHEMPTNFLMSHNFQSLQSTGAIIRLFHTIDGKLWWYRCEEVTKVLEYMRGT